MIVENAGIASEFYCRPSFSVADSPDEDPTIDQDVSSLTSFEELPHSSEQTSRSASGVGMPPPPALMMGDAAAVPSWASRTESDEPQTVLRRRGALGNASRELDERPVGCGGKSFEQLLADQLGCDVAALQQGPAFERTAPPAKPGGVKPRPFLKKGAGLAKYGGSPAKGLSRSKSQGSVGKGSTPTTERRAATNAVRGSTSCSRLDIADRETIAFASKKTPPKRSANAPAVSTKSAKSTVASRKSSEGPSSSPRLQARNVPSKSTDAAVPRTHQQQKQQQQPLAASGIPRADDRVMRGDVPVYDSVELSFREKLKKAGKNHEVRLVWHRRHH
jgi:hypothetical protein